MTLLEKTQKSSEHKVFTLYKEGMFYKCYNEDAMVFTEKVKGNSRREYIKIMEAAITDILIVIKYMLILKPLKGFRG